uniref:Secreted protein n=1 Tax=Opuntia streptacantha TaxID=393608 RepID=A0A7C9ENS8_OPUST
MSWNLLIVVALGPTCHMCELIFPSSLSAVCHSHLTVVCQASQLFDNVFTELRDEMNNILYLVSYLLAANLESMHHPILLDDLCLLPMFPIFLCQFFLLPS